MIAVSGVITDASGAFPTVAGSIIFTLSGDIEDGTGILASGPVKAVIALADGTFSLNLHPTLLSAAEYTFAISANYPGGPFLVNGGPFRVGALPAAQNFSDIINGLFGDPYVIMEVPTGLIDGFNRVFTLANHQFCNSEQIFLNGNLVDASQYSIDGNGRFVLDNVPQVGNTILVCYFRADTYGVNNRAFREALGIVNGNTSQYSFASLPEFGTDEVYVGGSLMTPDAPVNGYSIQIIQGKAYANFATPPASQPYAFYVKAPKC